MRLINLLLIFSCFLLYITSTYAQDAKPEDTEVWEPEPRKITFENGIPSDAIVLFGKDLSAWETEQGGSKAPWTVEGDHFTVKPGSGAIRTKKEFGDMQLHIEWKSPSEVKGEGQGRGNSGIFLSGLYEVQVLDSYNNRTYSNGQASSIYKQYMPMVNATKPPSEWEVYDIVYVAPRFKEDGSVEKPARVTVFHNGVVTQLDVELKGPTEYIGQPVYKKHGDGPLVLQDHGNPVSFRNIWIRPLDNVYPEE